MELLMAIDQRVRLDDDLAADVRAYAERYGINVTDAIRVLLRKGLEAELGRHLRNSAD
jgi:antitoxin component of RelBE/YafQ-DinJ toxin-antitoxin module